MEISWQVLPLSAGGQSSAAGEGGTEELGRRTECDVLTAESLEISDSAIELLGELNIFLLFRIIFKQF